MRFNYTTPEGTFTESAQEMLTNVFGDYTFASDAVTEEGITATHRHTGQAENWHFINGEDFAGWCFRCFPDTAIFEAVQGEDN